MINLPYETLLKKVTEHADIPEAEVEKKVQEKLEALSGLITKEGALQIIANDLGVKVLADGFAKMTVEQLAPGLRSVQLTLKVVDIYEPRTFERDGREGKLHPMLCGDETGQVRVVGWGAAADAVGELEKGDVVVIGNAYVKEGYRGGVEINLNERSTIDRNPGGVEVLVKDPQAVRKRVEDITKDDSLVEVFGTIVQAYDPYFYEAEAETGRKVTGKVAENVKTEYRGILNLFVDDSTGSIRTVFFNDQFKRLSETPLDELRESAEARETFKNALLGSFIVVSGRVRYSEQYDRLEINVDRFTANPDPDEELAKLEAQAPGKGDADA